MGRPLPDITADTFQRSKMWQKVTLLQGHVVLDSDFNEAQDILRYRDFLNLTTAVALDTRIGGGFYTSEASVPINNFYITSGTAVVFGAVVLAEGDITISGGSRVFAYDSNAPSFYNRMFEGTVTFVDASAHKLVDENKYWLPDHNMSACRVVMTSGAEQGNVFTIRNEYGTGWTENELYLDQIGAFGVQPGDTYVIIPPRLNTPSLGSSDLSRVDLVYLQTWYDNINQDEDSDINSGYLPDAQSDRLKLRWCVRVSEGYYDAASATMVDGTLPTPTDSDDPFGVHYMALATITRPSGEPRVFTSQISNYRGVEVPLPALSQEMVDSRTSSWFGDYESLDLRLDQMESTVRDSKLFNGSFELGESIGSNIPGWIPSSTSWFVTNTNPRHQSRCAVIDHSTRNTTRTETLISLPFYVRPNQKLLFKASAKAAQSGITVQAVIEVFESMLTWAAIPIQTRTLSFVPGTADWQDLSDEFNTVSRSQWARVKLITAQQENSFVYFDDIRVEYLEEGMANTRQTMPSVEVFSGRFGEGLRGWNVNQRYAENENVQIIVSSSVFPTLRLIPNGAITAPEISSWPVNVGGINLLDDVLVLYLEGAYRDLHYGLTESGPYVYLKFYDSHFNEITTTNEPLYLSVADWGTATSNTASPDIDTGYNMYTGLFSVPPNAAMFTVHVGLSSTSGYSDFRNIQVQRFGSSVSVDVNQSYHDLCSNGEFGRGLLDSDLSDAEKADPVTGTFEIMNWSISGEIVEDGDYTTGQIVHWMKNRPDILAPYGDRVVEFRVPGAIDVPGEGIKVLQTAVRTITQQDFLHGFVLDFEYQYSLAPSDASFDAQVEFLDSNYEVVDTVTRVSLIADAVVSQGWNRKVIGIAPPSRVTTPDPGLQVFKAPVYLRFGFRIVVPTASGEEFIARVAAVRLWSRTITTLINPITDTQYKALKGYYTHDTVGHTKADSFYESGLIEPTDDNHFLLENDRDLMRYTRLHGVRHYPEATNADPTTVPTDQNADAIPVASAVQTGLLSYVDWSQFDAAIQLDYMLGIIYPGIYEGLWLDAMGTVSPGVAYDKNGYKLELLTETTVEIIPDPTPLYDDDHIDIVYIYRATDGSTQIGMVTSTYDVPDPDLTAAVASIPDNAVILGCGYFCEDYYRGVVGFQAQTRDAFIIANGGGQDAIDLWDHGDPNDYATYPPHLAWMTVDEKVVGVWPQPTADTDRASEVSPSEYLINAEFTGLSDVFREITDPGTSPRVYKHLTPQYKILDYRQPAYRLIRQRDTNAFTLYWIDPDTYTVDTNNFPNTVVFSEFGDTTPYDDVNDPGWGYGQPLTGVLENWESFLDSVKQEIADIKGVALGSWDATPVIDLTEINTYFHETLNKDSDSTATHGLTDDNVLDTAGIEQKKLNFQEQGTPIGSMGPFNSYVVLALDNGAVNSYAVQMTQIGDPNYLEDRTYWCLLGDTRDLLPGGAPSYSQTWLYNEFDVGSSKIEVGYTGLGSVISGYMLFTDSNYRFASLSNSPILYSRGTHNGVPDLDTSNERAQCMYPVVLPKGTNNLTVKLRFFVAGKGLVGTNWVNGDAPVIISLRPVLINTNDNDYVFGKIDFDTTFGGGGSGGIISYGNAITLSPLAQDNGAFGWSLGAYKEGTVSFDNLLELDDAVWDSKPSGWNLSTSPEFVHLAFIVSYQEGVNGAGAIVADLANNGVCICGISSPSHLTGIGVGSQDDNVLPLSSSLIGWSDQPLQYYCYR
jgi:hypothetical protein